MRSIVITLFLLLTACASKPNIPHSDKSVIPHSWLTQKSSVSDIHEFENNTCILREELSREIEKEQGIELRPDQLTKCIKETSNPFEYDLVEGYQVYEYSGREDRRLETGFALVINEIVVDTVVSTIAE